MQPSVCSQCGQAEFLEEPVVAVVASNVRFVSRGNSLECRFNKNPESYGG
ncbi:MAG: hypothetical protein F6K25_05495 [Okeania sp. SIO2G4]|nr:hypothetical protein [Okeania sp. SIO4D6]NEP39912.1 hypothetical protein [Okeania sp. SIO2H7]NEP71260.1 hypothetical protein [Okeania sp. SIO2G5]NEP96936.1 hypothetical protein [Okeania sp. SIO2F5]NEQ90203.1 hypothetical protein [Okeania sp. SIO2G4]